MTSRPHLLRQRVIDDMAFRNMSPNTQKVYAYAVATFARFHRQSPDKLGLEHVREYRLHLVSRGLIDQSDRRGFALLLRHHTWPEADCRADPLRARRGHIARGSHPKASAAADQC